MLVEAPIFHLAPPSGWVNDPNGPLFYDNRYHLFYQHLGDSHSWSWGLSWGHVSSSDLVPWQHHQPALNPTPNSYDSDGCFSGCAVILPAAEAAAAGLFGDNGNTAPPPPTAAAAPAAGLLGNFHNTAPATASSSSSPPAAAGVQETGGAQHTQSRTHSSKNSMEADVMKRAGLPVLLYTGVVLRPDRPKALKPSSLTVSELCTERQLAAVAADASDPFLVQWRKLAGALLAHPPPHMCLNCFRDPFILERPLPSNHHTWRLMLGAGLRPPNTGLPCAGDASTDAIATATAAAAAAVDFKAANSSCSSSTSKLSEAMAASAAAVSHSCSATHSSSDGNSNKISEAVTAEGLSAHAAGPAGGSISWDPRRAAHGTALVYKSKQLLSGWQFEGLLCTAHQPNTDGAIWECPILAQLPFTPGNVTPSTTSTTPVSSPPAACATGAVAPSHFFSVSTGSSPAVYWLGQYADGRFDLENALGPLPLDLGDLLYAPNLLTATQGDANERVMLWGWLSELPHQHCSTAGCLSLPRQLSLSAEGHLVQQPLPELTALHTGPAWSVDELLIEPQAPRHIGLAIPSSYFHLQLTLSPDPSAAEAAAGKYADSSSTRSLPAIVLPAWASEGNSSSSSSGTCHDSSQTAVGEGVVLLYDFATCQLCLTVGPGVGAELLPLQGSTLPVDLPPVDAPPTLLPGRKSKAVVAGLQHPSLGTCSGTALSAGTSQHGFHSEKGAGSASSVLEKYMPAGGDSSLLHEASSASGRSVVSLSDGVRHLGGQLRLQPFQPLELQLFMDYSLLEVFSGDGQVLATRVYRGIWPSNSSSKRSSATTQTVHGAAQPNFGPGPVYSSNITVALGGSCSPTNSTGSQSSRPATHRSSEAVLSPVNTDEAPEELQGPGGVYLLSVGYSAVAEHVSMHAMGNACG